MAFIELHIRINDTFMPVLSIPVDDCNRFSVKPLRWLRFLGYTIFGSHGDILVASDGRTVDYGLAVEGGARYYFTSPETARLLDNQCINDRISVAETTESRAEFRAALDDRDVTCIVTGMASRLCEGAHILPHSKGSEYIRQMMEVREGPEIDDINDIRNGLLLNKLLHAVFGLGDIAFLRTPNFAMQDTDVPPSPGPILGTPSGSLARGRFILQYFKEDDYLQQRIAPHNQDARLPVDMSVSPNRTILDMYYGCAALLRWGIPQAIEAIQSIAGPLYYDESDEMLGEPSGEDENGEDNTPRLPAPTAPETVRLRRAGLRPRNRLQPGISTVGEAMDLITLLWSRSAPGGQESEEPANQKEEENFGEERVKAWLRTQ